MQTSEVIRMNQWYFSSLRHAAVTNLSDACLSYNVTKEFAQKVAKLSTEEIEALAHSGKTLFKPIISPQAIDSLCQVSDDMRAIYGQLALGGMHG